MSSRSHPRPVPGRRACRSWLAAAVVAAICAGLPARADVIHLTNGRTLEGDTVPGPRPGTVEIRRGDGTVVILTEDRIERIEKAPSERARLEEDLARVPSGELEPLEALLARARSARLSALARSVAGKIVAIDPHHAEARAELGYVVFENRWVKRDELGRQDGLERVGDEWVRPEEKARRAREDASRQLSADLESLASANEYVRNVAFARVRSVLGRDEPWVRDVAAEHLAHESGEVRKVALAVIARFPLAGPAPDDAGLAVAGRLHQLALEEEDPGVREVLRVTVARFAPRESFRLALAAVLESPSAATRGRAADALYFSLQKSLVPDLCRAVSGAGGSLERSEVRGVLRRVFRSFGVDFGYDAERWLEFWREHEREFYDDDGRAAARPQTSTSCASHRPERDFA